MKNYLLVLLVTCIGFGAKAQLYSTTDLEMIFSFANVKENGSEISSPLRWSPVFNFGLNGHYDMSDNVGFYAGLNVKNIGFIANTSNGKRVNRTYNLGIPVGVKVGNLSGLYFYGGYEFELPFHYKYKGWQGSDRDGPKVTYTRWFSDATPTVMHTVFAGIKLYGGLNVKFKYYLTEFLNQDYVYQGTMPHAGIEAQVFSISLVGSIMRNAGFYDYSSEK